MEPKAVERLRDWIEPAHPIVVKLFEDLTAIYRLIREKFQVRIDAAFDGVSRKIGFVVATTLPVTIEVGDGGRSKISMGAQHLKDTLFDAAISEALSGLSFKDVPEGRYQVYVLWYEALRLKLHTDWMEPAHFLQDHLRLAGQATQTAEVRPEVREPAHWFNPGWALTVEEAVLISAIDTVYPELRLGAQVAAYRQMRRHMARPEVREPAHTRPLQPGSEPLI